MIGKEPWVRQLQRIGDLHAHLNKGSKREAVAFILKRMEERRTPSSVEEELASKLPLFDSDDAKRINRGVGTIARKHKIPLNDQRLFDIVAQENPELGREMKSFGMLNFQHKMQVDFYDGTKEIFEMGMDYEFPAKYEILTPLRMGDTSLLVVEGYEYPSARGYRSVLYQMLRHLATITGEETAPEIMKIAKETFSGKRILELGSGPGFFLYVLKQLGADVTGIDTNGEVVKQAKKTNLNIVQADAKELSGLSGPQYDIVFSRDFLSFSVTKDAANTIMSGVFPILKEGGLTLHQINYRKRSEKEYLAWLRKYAESKGLDPAKFMASWQQADEMKKEMILRCNVLNIPLEVLEKMGFQPYASYRLDVEDNLTIVLGK